MNQEFVHETHKKTRWSILLILVLILSLGGNTLVFAAGNTESAAKESSPVYAVAETSVRLLEKSMEKENDSKNILISPDSILSAVLMVENGASGKTLQEMESVLGNISVSRYSQYLSKLHKRFKKEKSCTYQNANSIWYKKGAIKLKKSYISKVSQYFNADMKKVSFLPETVTQINNWVSENTKGKIKKILDRINPDIRLIAINAVYFKGNWAQPYYDTNKYTFTNASGTKKKVPTLVGAEDTYVNIAGADGFVKYYQGGQFAFVGLLPPKNLTVKQYVKNLTGKDFIDGYKNRTTKNIEVFTRMPEFKYEYEKSLKKPFQSLGVKIAFSDKADFSGMTNLPVKIDDILHKTYIDLNKNGTEAAAVTAVLVAETTAYEPEKTIKKVYLNRPFVYAIIDTKTGLPLFLGAVNTI